MKSSIMTPLSMSKASVAVNRFGYGARGDELIKAEKNPKKWIVQQLQPIAFGANYPSSSDIFFEHVKFLKDKKRQKQQQKNNQSSSNALVNEQPNNMKKMDARNALRSMSADTLKQAVNSTHSVSWRLLDFFSNHFSVSGNGRLMKGLAPTLEREAIAPNMLGNFEDILMAVEQHPAMLIYLNNEKSFGPNSRMSKRNKKGLNENLAREILELHTLGVNGGYDQSDVIELAKGITGWSVLNPRKERHAGFTFRANGHEPGTRKLLGNKYSQGGIAQGEQMLRDLAINPATAKHLSYKLAHHFVSETPSQNLLKEMEDTWLQTRGNIRSVMLTLFESDDAWLESPQKFKTPREFVISTLRALGSSKINDKALYSSVMTLGQQPFNAGSPAGYSDSEKDWLGASALMARIDWSVRASSYRKRVNAEKIMNVSLGLEANTHTYQSVMRAESRQQALTLLLMSPEFQRR